MTATAAAPTPEPQPRDELRRIPLAELHESPLNPRKHFEPHALEEIKDSLLAVGQLTPITVRPRKGGGYEIAAGHRRYRAAKLAVERHAEGARFRGLHELLAVIRDLDEPAFVEVLNIENLQRDDLHPLEEAEGFKTLIERARYDVKKIAARIGKSERYVYDSLTLLKLIPEARKLFLSGAFERGHAVELARLTADWQKVAIDPEDVDSYRIGGLFQPEHAGVDPNLPEQEALKLQDAVKPVTVREFKHWVNEKVRFKPAETDPVLFPETASLLGKAVLEKEKVIEITYEYQIPDEARDEQGPKIRGARAWRSATPDRESPDVFGTSRAGQGKPCEHSVVGVIVIGEGRGDAFRVCVAKEKCKVHWSDWQKARAKGSAQASGGTAKKERESREQEQERWDRDNKKREALRKRWETAQPAILEAVAAKLKTAPVGPTSDLADAVLAACVERGKPDTTLPRGRTLEDFLRHAAFQLYVDDVHSLAPGYYNHDHALKNIKALGIDAAKIVDQVAPEEKTAKPQTAAKSTAKPKAKAKGKKK